MWCLVIRYTNVFHHCEFRNAIQLDLIVKRLSNECVHRSAMEQMNHIAVAWQMAKVSLKNKITGIFYHQDVIYSSRLHFFQFMPAGLVASYHTSIDHIIGHQKHRLKLMETKIKTKWIIEWPNWHSLQTIDSSVLISSLRNQQFFSDDSVRTIYAIKPMKMISSHRICSHVYDW